jgi:DNA-binding MarR family transcriptional regulator
VISLSQPAGHEPASATRSWLELSGLLSRCERLLRDELAQRSSQHGLSDAQLSLLWMCSQAPPAGLSQSELAQALALSAAHISGQVEQLRSRGLLAGQRSAPDRRRQVWQLTGEGQARLDRLLDELVGWSEQLEQGLPSDRRQTLQELLNHLLTALGHDTHRPAAARLYHPDASTHASRAGGLS